MAILTGIFRKQTGSIGDMTLRMVNGQTITSEKVHKNNSKSFLQMARRVRWANILNLWRAFNGTLRPSFQDRPPLRSDFNMFIGANINGVPVYLSSSEAKQGGCVVAAYQVTRGSLPTIDIGAGTGGVPVTDIALGNLVIDSDTTLKQFSDAVVNNNENYHHGDQISCYIALQDQNAVTGIPYVTVKAYEVTLDQLDEETLLSDLVDADGFSAVDGKLGANSTVNGGIVWVHSRKQSNGTAVSTQFFYVTNALLAQYQTSAKRIEAIRSYGGETSQAFLVPNTDEAIASA